MSEADRSIAGGAAPIAAPRGRPLPEVARLARSVVGLPAMALRRRALPRGEGGPVLVIPGFLTSDRSTVVLRRFLAGLGHRAFGWRLGVNRGHVEKLLPHVIERAEAVAGDRPLKLVGWSLGGVLARELARERPDLVERIVTMGTPVVGGPKYTFTARHYARRGVDLDAIEARIAARNAEPLGVPVTAIYTRADEIVAWRACLDENPANDVRHVEVTTSHIGLGFDPVTLALVADALVEVR